MQALREMRRARRARRLGDLEWFDIAYRVYLTALFGGSAVIVVSDLVGDLAVAASRQAELAERAPGVLGFVAALAVALGIRSGTDGGPVSVEAADVRHLMLAPVPRRLVLGRPFAQRARSLVVAGAAVGAIAGQLAAQRLDGTAAGWAFGGALAGAAICLLGVAIAVVAHASRIGRGFGTALGGAVVIGQALAVDRRAAGPGDPFGHLAILGWDTAHANGAMVAAALSIPIALAAVAYAVVGNLRVEPLVRRAALVSQLRFAVTVQDLRTVIVLRRQLRNETARRRPWVRPPRRTRSHPTPSAACRARAARGIARTPAARLGRMAVLAIAAGASVHVVVEGTTPAIVVTGVALFLLGLDALEPLSQEIDHPTLTDAYPVERGRIHAGLLVVPALMLVPFAGLGAVVVAVGDPGRAAASITLAVPLAWVGLAGATVAVVRDASSVQRAESSMVPPEFAGFGTVMRTAVPVGIAMLAAIPVLAMRATPDVDVAVRSVVGVGLVLAATWRWVTRRDAWARRWREFVASANPNGAAT